VPDNASRVVLEKEPLSGTRVGSCVYARLALVLAAVTVVAFVGAIWIYRTNGPAVDFTSFWAAGRLALQGHGALAYDYATHRSVEATVVTVFRPLPFSYPPPFLLIVTPFALAPYWAAYPIWMITTGAIYLVAIRRILPARYALAFPGALDNVIFGQNAFLTCSGFQVGASLLESRPLLAGAILGLFICKPQLALLFPVAVLAGRHWRAIVGAAASSIAALALATLLFGIQSYAGFFSMTARFAVMMRTQSEWPWEQVASAFGFACYLGAWESVALSLQLVCAFLAVALTWRAWAHKVDQRVPVLAASTLLVSPYLFTYDSLLLLIPAGWFLRERRPGRAALIWLASLLTVLSLFRLCPVPNLTPVAALMSLWWLHSGDRRAWRLGPLEPRMANA